MGGNTVDNNYLLWLTKLFGQRTMQRFQEEQMEDYFNLHRDFETKKRNVRSDTDGKITFRVSALLKEIYHQVESASLNDNVAALGLSEEITFTGDKLRVHASGIKEWFVSPVNHMISHVQSILAEQKMRNVQTILLVGGFSESELVQQEMKRAIKKQRIIIPTDAELVLKGAVRFGHVPEIVSARVMSFTYGIVVLDYYDASKHPMSKVVIKNNKKLIDDVFRIFVRVGEEVKVGQAIYQSNYIPNDLQTTGLLIYRSDTCDPEYVTDEGCTKLGVMTINHPEGHTLDDKKFDVTFIFGDTELLVKAKIIKTWREFSTYVDCLS